MKYRYIEYDNYCEECGEPISDYYTYCREHAYNTCKCGHSKKREHELCKYCFEDKLFEEKCEANGSANCPICDQIFAFSEYLNEIFPSKQMRLLANLITHYRHSHQSSWNKSCHYISQYLGEDAYQKAKKEHNNRAKRQILRKCKEWLFFNKIEAEHFFALKDNDQATIDLIAKVYNFKIAS